MVTRASQPPPERIVRDFDVGDTDDDRYGARTFLTGDGVYVLVDATGGTSRRRLRIVGSIGIVTASVLGVEPDRWKYYTDTDDGFGLADLPAERHLADSAGSEKAGEHIVEILDGDTENLSPPEDGAHALEIIVGVFLSHYTSASLSLPLPRILEDVTISTQ